MFLTHGFEQWIKTMGHFHTTASGEKIELWRTEELLAEIREYYDRACLCDAEWEIRIYSARGGIKHIRHQCLRCGEPIGNSLPKKNFNIEDLSEFDNALVENYRQLRKKEYDDIIRKHYDIQSEKEIRFSKEYREHLSSDKWQRIREKVLARSNGVCEGCGDRPATDVHHKTYLHLGDEFLFELLALCHPCHDRWHDS